MKERPEVLHNEKGILINKGIYFHEPSQFAVDHLFYPYFGAEYTVVPPYRVFRHNNVVHYYLFMAVIDGELVVETEKGIESARNYEVIFLDADKEHSYYCTRKTNFVWMYFSGAMTPLYYDLLAGNSVVFKNQSEGTLILDSLIKRLKNGSCNEHRASAYIYDILTRFSVAAEPDMPEHIDTAIKYMHHHYNEDLSLTRIADHVSLHPVYFSRIFKEATGYAPHEYLLRIRMQQAKQMLADTNLTIEQIAEQCGFSSSTHFIRAFKKRTLVTPMMFRKYFLISGFPD